VVAVVLSTFLPLVGEEDLGEVMNLYMKKLFLLGGCFYFLQAAQQYQQEAISKRNELKMDPQRDYLERDINNALDQYREYTLKYEMCQFHEQEEKERIK
jgi:hypothetical protein